VSVAPRGKLIVVSGPSGSGKTTICDILEKRYGCEYVVTATTRAPRAGEADGVDYQFLTKPQFEARLAAGEFLEHASVHGNLYGTPRRAVEEALARGATLILEIDTQGAAQIRTSGIAHTSVFIQVPDFAVLEKRLRARNTESKEVLERRLARAREEIAEHRSYSFVVTNDVLERAVAEVAELLGLQIKNAVR
jgi:guanylate kinase